MGSETYEYRPTPAQLFADAVWAAPEEELTPLEAFVCLAYAAHTRRGADRCWMTQRRLMRRCKIGSFSTVKRIHIHLVGKGWLEPVEAAPVRGGRTVTYRLTIPNAPVESAPASEAVTGESAPTVGAQEGESAPLSEAQEANAPISGAHMNDGPIESAPISGAVCGAKRYTVHSKALQSGTESAPISGEELHKSGPPEGGGPDAGAHASAPAPAREAAARKAAPQDQNPATANGRKRGRVEALAELRRILPPGKPLSRFPRADPGGDRP